MKILSAVWCFLIPPLVHTAGVKRHHSLAGHDRSLLGSHDVSFEGVSIINDADAKNKTTAPVENAGLLEQLEKEEERVTFLKVALSAMSADGDAQVAREAGASSNSKAQSSSHTDPADAESEVPSDTHDERDFLGGVKHKYSARLEKQKRKTPTTILFVTIVGLLLTVVSLFTYSYWPVVVRSEEAHYSWWSRLFLNHENPKFGADYELAFRGAFFVILLGVPLLFYNQPIAGVRHAIEKGYYSSASVVYFIYTLYKSVGETVSFAWGGVCGTFFAVFNVWVLYGFYPDGVSEKQDGAFAVALVNGGLFVITFLWLNVSMSTAIFAISTWVYFWMAFLEPTPDNFSTNFRIEIKGTAINCLAQCSAGCIFAILATMLPYPIWAMDKAIDTATRVDKSLTSTWNDFLHCFENMATSDAELAQVTYKIECLASDINDLHSHVANAWWECFGFGRWQHVRVMVGRLERALFESYDLLSATMQCLSSHPGPHRKEMMAILKGSIAELLTAGSSLMGECTRFAVDGTIDHTEEEALRKQIEETREAIMSLSAKFVEAKASLGLPNVSEDTLDEHFFAFSACAYGRVAVEYAEDALSHSRGRCVLPETSPWITILDQGVLFEKGHLSYTLRSSLSIFLGFAIGFQGYGKIVPAYSAEIAGIMALLLSKFIGSAMTKNLGRLQGVVLGTIVGQTLYALFGWCTWWGTILVGLSLFSWTYLTLFMYYNSTQYSYLGVLLSAFGSSNMLASCKAENFTPSSSYGSIVSIVLAISIMISIDLILSSESASEMAYNSLLHGWNMIQTSVKDHFDKSELDSRFHRGAILDELNAASDLALEADNEPRFYRKPWNESLFEGTKKSMGVTRFFLSMMEYAGAEGCSNGAPKRQEFLQLLELPTFGKIEHLLVEKMDLIEKLLPVFVKSAREMHEICESRSLKAELLRDFIAEEKVITTAFYLEVNKSSVWDQFTSAQKKKSSGTSAGAEKEIGLPAYLTTLENDVAVQISIVLAVSVKMLGCMRKLQFHILQHV